MGVGLMGGAGALGPLLRRRLRAERRRQPSCDKCPVLCVVFCVVVECCVTCEGVLLCLLLMLMLMLMLMCCGVDVDVRCELFRA